MNVIEDNEYTDFLKKFTKNITPPKTIVVISAHWQSNGTYITGWKNPAQIYDFWWFPEKLYTFKYAPQGNPELAEKIASDDIGVKIDKDRGIDHAAWAVLTHMYKDNEIRLVEISLDINKTLEQHFELGKKLAKYRDEDVLFIWSGNIVHNLGNISFDETSKPFSWAVKLDEWFKEQIQKNNIDKLLHYTQYLPNYEEGIPTTEHYIPLLYTLWMMLSEEKITTIHESIQNGSISMRSIETVSYTHLTLPTNREV